MIPPTEPPSNTPLRRLRTLLASYDFEPAEFLVGAACLGWGIWLLNPWWDTFGGSPTFAAMAQAAPEWLWGVAMALLGAAALIGMVRDRMAWRRAAQLGLAMVWAFIAASFWQSNLPSTGSVTYPLLALVAAWSFWRMRMRGR